MWGRRSNHLWLTVYFHIKPDSYSSPSLCAFSIISMLLPLLKSPFYLSLHFIIKVLKRRLCAVLTDLYIYLYKETNVCTSSPAASFRFFLSAGFRVSSCGGAVRWHTTQHVSIPTKQQQTATCVLEWRMLFWSHSDTPLNAEMKDVLLCCFGSFKFSFKLRILMNTCCNFWMTLMLNLLLCVGWKMQICLFLFMSSHSFSFPLQLPRAIPWEKKLFLRPWEKSSYFRKTRHCFELQPRNSPFFPSSSFSFFLFTCCTAQQCLPSIQRLAALKLFMFHRKAGKEE